MAQCICLSFSAPDCDCRNVSQVNISYPLRGVVRARMAHTLAMHSITNKKISLYSEGLEERAPGTYFSVVQKKVCVLPQEADPSLRVPQSAPSM